MRVWTERKSAYTHLLLLLLQLTQFVFKRVFFYFLHTSIVATAYYYFPREYLRSYLFSSSSSASARASTFRNFRQNQKASNSTRGARTTRAVDPFCTSTTTALMQTNAKILQHVFILKGASPNVTFSNNNNSKHLTQVEMTLSFNLLYKLITNES